MLTRLEELLEVEMVCRIRMRDRLAGVVGAVPVLVIFLRSYSGTVYHLLYQSGAIAVGISCNGGAVLASLNPSTSVLMREVDPEIKIAVVSPQAAMTYAGLAADFRVLVSHAR